ncbi:thiolase family protein [Desulfococcus multivorans]|uniref:Acetyl-CoA acetyltransferase n=1 Tax=Desulfococcus multivorans DSM 2059 TaxID=1121405 RepID=S7V2E2_DESML|nr:thiolase family protein [Desulfococcus multivorans]AOY57696.1 FadA: 3-ketoacyl-CoA thiolase (Beta-ketothiolase) (Acetyl-CoA acyltransferase) [Desulfococcus multivorans]AQV00093.1 acetyl-CoA acetyltransferase [Desulfococcus multivorans]EPR38778.1 acetyl-CoA acetyltransferase [Desulfococcus multivorans DSM 2059]SJZ79130.1 3-ketoacyl-CoA thiolase [Desulfococcus multivorans DSM 2059]
MRDAYIVTAIRTPGCRRNKGAFKDTRPEELLSFILRTVVEKTPGLDVGMVDDVMIGCAFPEAEQGLNIGRIAAQIAGFPEKVGGATVNRFCASGLEAIALCAMRIMAGWSDITLGGGVESMTFVPMPGNLPRPDADYSREHPELYVSMGITAENVASRYGISRKDQDEFAHQSQMKASKALEGKLFKEIVPTPAVKFVKRNNGIFAKETFLQDFDDGIRPATTLEGLGKLYPVFRANGSVTAGNSSQMTDGAAATVLMSGEMVNKLGITPIARLKHYTTVGCRADEMGVGPRYAIPKLLDLAGLSIEDIGLWEINEAFASQALYCIRELGLDKYMDRINVYGGAIALGHPLGCTGAKLCAQLVHRMKERGVKYGVESMCVGGGMGAAALFELCD